MKIPFGEWTPDLPDYANPGATEAKNVIPGSVSYLPMPSLEVYSTAINERCQGMVAGRDNDANEYVFCGDDTDLYRLLTDATWDEISSSTGAYTCGSTSRWEFAQFGEVMVASQIGNYPQQFTMGTSSVWSNLTTDLKSKSVAVVRDFMVHGNTWDSTDGTVPHRVRWSAIGDITNYTVSSTTQSDYQDLDAAAGFVQKVIGGEYAVIFQERAITRVTYTGSATIFDFDQVEVKRGTPAPGSVVKFGDLIAYLSEDGFYIFDGNNSQSISNNKISRTFYADVNTSFMDRITSTVDYGKQLIMWAYPSLESTDGTCDKILLYHYATESNMRWSWVEADTQAMAHIITGGYTLDGLDTVSTNIDSMLISLDSRYWTGNNELIGAFNSSNQLSTFTGAALPATIETGETDNNGERVRVNKIRPLIDGGTTTIQVATRSRLQDSITWDTAASVQDSGNVAVRATGLYHRYRANITGDFNQAQAIEIIEAVPTGKR